MSRFVNDETDAIDLGGGDVVHIRHRMSYGQQRILGSLVAGKDAATATSEYLVAVLEHNVVSWEGPGFQNGTGPMPLTRSSFDKLDPDIALRLVNEIATRNGAQPESFTPTAMDSLPPSSDTAERSPSASQTSASANGSAGPGTSS